MKRAASVTAGCVLCLAAAAASAQTGAVPAGDFSGVQPSVIETPASLSGGVSSSAAFEKPKQPAF